MAKKGKGWTAIQVIRDVLFGLLASMPLIILDFAKLRNLK